MHNTTHDLISTGEAAELAKRNRSTITRWVQAGRLTPAYRTPGGVLMFRPSDVEAAAEEQAS